jgi:hypothetical protein
MWYKDGKLVKTSSVPKEVIEGTTNEKEESKKSCIFCNGEPEHQRMILVEGKQFMVSLCGVCYYEKTFGEVFGLVKKLRGEDGKDNKTT